MDIGLLRRCWFLQLILVKIIETISGFASYCSMNSVLFIRKEIATSPSSQHLMLRLLINVANDSQLFLRSCELLATSICEQFCFLATCASLATCGCTRNMCYVTRNKFSSFATSKMSLATSFC